jgi:hypothetical protein
MQVPKSGFVRQTDSAFKHLRGLHGGLRNSFGSMRLRALELFAQCQPLLLVGRADVAAVDLIRHRSHAVVVKPADEFS